MSHGSLSRLTTNLRKRWHRPAGYLEILALAGPLVLSTGTTTVQQFINRMFLSWYSPEALAASLPAGTVSFTVLCFFIGTASYANTFVAQYHGAGQPSQVARSVWQGIWLAVGSGLLVIPLALLAGPLFRAAGHAPEVQALETSYFRILTLGGGLPIISAAVSSFFTGLGDTRTVMRVNVAATALNAVLDYALIFGRWGCPELGIVGAAYATVIAQTVATAVFLWLFVRGRLGAEYHVWASRGFDRDLFGRLLRYGAPSGLHFMLDLIAWSLFILLVGRLGTVALGATNLAIQVNMLIFCPMIGFSMATATLVGQRLGQNRPDLATRTTWSAFHLTFIYMTTLAVLYLTVPDVFLRPFGARANPAEFAQLRELAIIMLRFIAVYSIFDGGNLIFSAALKGAGDTVFVMALSSSLAATLLVAPTWYFCHAGEGNIWGAWAALTIFVVVLALSFLARFLRGKWKTMRVTGTVHAPACPTYPHPESPVPDAEVL